MLRPGHAVALCVLALLCLGVVMVSSAGMSVRARDGVTLESILLSRHALNMVLAVGAMAVCAMLPIRRLVPPSVRGSAEHLGGGPPFLLESTHRWLSLGWLKDTWGQWLRLWPFWLGTLGLVGIIATVYLPGIARPRNGAHRWITFHVPGLESIQPSEIAKWGLVLLIAWYGARFAARIKNFWLGLAPGIGAAGLVAAAIVIEDLGTGVLVALSATVILMAAGGRVWQLVVLTPLPVLGIVGAIVTSPYRLARVESFIDPYSDPLGKGFHQIQSMSTVANGQVFGRGLGHGLNKFGYLPEDTTDFLFAIVCEELGVIGAALVLGIFALLIWSIWLIVRRERWMVLRLLGVGVMGTLGIQAVINLAVVTGLGPTKGIALPLLSSGGTGWILTAAALGLIIATDRTQERTERNERDARPASVRMGRERPAGTLADLKPV